MTQSSYTYHMSDNTIEFLIFLLKKACVLDFKLRHQPQQTCAIFERAENQVVAFHQLSSNTHTHTHLP